MTEVEAAFLFADLSGFTALTEAHGDVDAADVAQRFEEIALRSLRHEAQLAKTIGDEVMVVAPGAASAVETALELARRVEAEPRFPGVRAGLHVGPAIRRGTDYFGAAVNLAARVAAHARARQILATEAIVSALDEAQARWAAAGTVRFKNVSEPVPLFQLVDPGGGGLEQEIDPVCRMALAPETAAGTFRHAGRQWHFCSLRCTRAFVSDPDRYVSAGS